MRPRASTAGCHGSARFAANGDYALGMDDTPLPGLSANLDKGSGGGGSFAIFRGEDEVLSGIRSEPQLNEDDLEDLRRSRQLWRHPRPLTGDECRILLEAADPVLCDLAATGMELPDIRPEAREERAASVCGFIQESDGSGAGIWVSLPYSLAERVASLAEQIQDWAADRIDDMGLSTQWPGCPEHASDRRERLVPSVQDGSPVWICPKTSRVISVIGKLPSRDRRISSKYRKRLR
jgi:hypothetical protein